MTFPKDAEIDNARAEIAETKKELSAAQEVLKKTTEELNKAIAEDKMADLNAFTLDKAMSMIAGTARSMGITVTGNAPF